MSQVFAGDSVRGAAAVPIAVSAETPIVTSNFVNPPFQNAKAIVIATVDIVPGTGNNYTTMKLRRNPNGENVVVGSPANYTMPSSSEVVATFMAADAIPDGRAVQYQLTLTQSAATATGTVNSSTISVILISG